VAVAPEVRFARSGEIDIAYQVLGDGPTDLVVVLGAFTHLHVLWEEPRYRRWCERLAEFTRVILFDKRGMGLSDRVPAGTLEERMEDVRAVMDAAGSRQAVLLGVSEGGPMSIVFAATYPERTRALVLAGAEVKEETTEDWPYGEATLAEHEEFLPTIPDRWGKGLGVATIWPSAGLDPAVQAWWGRLQVASATPRIAEQVMRIAFEIDVRAVAPTVRVPTLIVHAVGDRVCHIGNARWLAEHVPGARLVELDGDDHAPWGTGGDVLVEEVRELVTGAREAAEPDRVLATVLFTDIVGSTEEARRRGDAGWADLLERHHERVRGELERYRGREIDTAGDGFLASFDGPARGIRCALAVRESVGALGLGVRAGLHTGECEVVSGRLRGIAVHIGARVAAQARAGEVLVSQTVRDLVAGSGIALEDRGLHALKGLDEEWRLFAVEG
jgi:pimeloyl-ACP methyl ester carboxylesterase